MRRNWELFLGFTEVYRCAEFEKEGEGRGPVGGVEHLDGFQNHFDDVLVGVPLGRQLRVGVENEDVHGGDFG